MQHLGYIRKENIFPGPLISIGKEKDAFYAIYPTGDKLELTDVSSIDYLKSDSAFIESPSENVPKLAYAVDRDCIYSGDIESVANDILKLATSVNTSLEYKNELLSLVAELSSYIEINSDSPVAILDKYKTKTLSGKKKIGLTLVLTERVLKNNHGKGNRMLIQWASDSETKTIYKKNIRYGKRLIDAHIPNQTQEVLESYPKAA